MRIRNSKEIYYHNVIKCNRINDPKTKKRRLGHTTDATSHLNDKTFFDDGGTGTQCAGKETIRPFKVL